MNRRTFLKLSGAGSLTLASGCLAPDEHKLYSLVKQPEDLVTGKASWYASVCRECPAGCGILAKSREDRVIKIEGNPLHPVNRGKVCIRGQAAVQGVYDPDRLRTPLLKSEESWKKLSFSEAQALLKDRIESAGAGGPGRIRAVTETIGEPLLGLLNAAMLRWQSPPPLVFESYAYESMKAAHRLVLGTETLPTYRMEEADFLLSSGADFVETWLSPVEYARKFKSMHAIRDGVKGFFCHLSSYQSLTGANADLWLSCRPRGESIVLRFLIKAALETGRGARLDPQTRGLLASLTANLDLNKASRRSGIEAVALKRMAERMLAADQPLILGSGVGVEGKDALQIDAAAVLLQQLLDPSLALLDFSRPQQVGIAFPRGDIVDFFRSVGEEGPELLLLNNVNPVFNLPPALKLDELLASERTFVVSFSNFMDETSRLADLILPVTLPLESWDVYGAKVGLVGTLQPAMGRQTGAPHLGDVLLRTAFGDESPSADYRAYLMAYLRDAGRIETQLQWLEALERGGIFESPGGPVMPDLQKAQIGQLTELFEQPSAGSDTQLCFKATPSIRYFDGRGANKSWLSEVPDTLTQVAWTTPVLIHPDTMVQKGLSQGDLVKISSRWGAIEAPVYETVNVHPSTLVMNIGQGHTDYGRFARDHGANPIRIMNPDSDSASGAPNYAVVDVMLTKTGGDAILPHTDGSRFQHGRKIALSVSLTELHQPPAPEEPGYTMFTYPLVLPLPEGYKKPRDIYPPHTHDGYRWSMVVDMDRCIGCGACAGACYAENNLGVVGASGILQGREMAWLQIQRYLDPESPERTTFLPMLCQHCDDAPCESVCPVFAPHHSKEGINNQIYNRCIGTRFCAQNCPYKVRRFNWFDWKWPPPLNLQLNPDVTVRSKGVMEKCSFCVQRIKVAHGIAKDENRPIRDGEVSPACVQTCPTDALIFGNLMDPQSRVRRLVEDRRAYQVMGYLNTKPAVFYLKKVVQEI